MSNTSRKHKKMRAVQPEVVELYKNKEFISNSMSTISVSSIRFSADGQRTTHVLGNISDRHLLADLKLPELQERCAIAANKNLYELSQQLAEPEEINSGNDTEVAVQQPTELEEALETDVHRKLPKMPWRRNDPIGIESEHRRKLKEKASRKLLFTASMKTQPIGDTVASTQKVVKEKRSKKKAKHKKVQIKSSDDAVFTTARTNKDEISRAPSYKECGTEVSPKKLQSMYCGDMQQQQHLSDLSVLSQLEGESQLDNDSIKYGFADDNYSQGLQFMKQMAKTIDDWHAFTLLLFVGTFSYLFYILFYDVNEYVNEERRYRQKMNDAGFVLRCFYYVMRLLKVRMF